MNRTYRLAARVFHLLPLPSGKLAQSRAGRVAAGTRWLEWARRFRSREPLVWLHGASVGEAQVTEPVARRLRARYPQLQLIQTYSSPSMEGWPQSRHVDHSDYLPPEQPEVVHTLLETLRPTVIVVSRGDLWPELVCGAYAGGIPVAVVGASVRPGSRRLRWPARDLMRSTYDGLRFVGAASRDDADRWIRLGATPAAVTVTGDPRDDHVLERASNYAALLPLIPWAHAGPTLVAGSTDHRDEAVLLAALARIGAIRPEARLIVVPHEVAPDVAVRVARDAARLGIVAAGWVEGTPAPETRVLVVERLGLLADLYALGTLSYVGGGFGPGGHSLAEPAAYGVPALSGPAAHEDAAAARFLSSGGAVALDGDHAVESLVERWEAWLAEPDARTAAGVAARAQLEAGVADRTVSALIPLLSPRG